MKRNLSLRLLALSISLLLGSLPLQAAERPSHFQEVVQRPSLRMRQVT